MFEKKNVFEHVQDGCSLEGLPVWGLASRILSGAPRVATLLLSVCHTIIIEFVLYTFISNKSYLWVLFSILELCKTLILINNCHDKNIWPILSLNIYVQRELKYYIHTKCTTLLSISKTIHGWSKRTHP